MRTWLPLVILGLLILALFPMSKVDFRQHRSIPWGGQVVLVQREKGAADHWLLLATLPGTLEERPAHLVIGATVLAADSHSRALLLHGGPPARITPKIRLDGTYSALLEELDLSIHAYPLTDQTVLPRPGGLADPVGMTISEGNLSDGKQQWTLPESVGRGSASVRYDDKRFNLWRGPAVEFDERWKHLSENNPGQLIPYIEARIVIAHAGQK